MEKKIITYVSEKGIYAKSEDDYERYKADDLINTLKAIKKEGYNEVRFRFECHCWSGYSSDAEAEVTIEGISQRKETDEEYSERLKEEKEKRNLEIKQAKEAQEAIERDIYLKLKAKYEKL